MKGSLVDFLKPENIALAVAVFAPGVVAMMVYDLVSPPSERRDFSKATVEAAVYGGINFVLWRPAFEWIHTNYASRWFASAGLGILVHLLSPMGLAFATFALRTFFAKRGVLGLHPTPTAWDYAFKGRSSCWLRVRLKDGSYVGGQWAGGSFAGASSTKRDLYIERAWRLVEGGNFAAVPSLERSSLLIREDDIALIEFIEEPRPEEERNEQVKIEVDAARLPAQGEREQREGLSAGIAAGPSSAATTDEPNNPAPTTAEKVGDIS